MKILTKKYWINTSPKEIRRTLLTVKFSGCAIHDKVEDVDFAVDCAGSAEGCDKEAEVLEVTEIYNKSNNYGLKSEP